MEINEMKYPIVEWEIMTGHYREAAQKRHKAFNATSIFANRGSGFYIDVVAPDPKGLEAFTKALLLFPKLVMLTESLLSELEEESLTTGINQTITKLKATIKAATS